MTAKDLLRGMVPPLLLTAYRRAARQEIRYVGRPGSWSEARRNSMGYEAEAILQRVRASTRAVIEGRASFERDGILFDAPNHPFALLAALWRAAAQTGGNVEVIDFGGSLGSTYRQCVPLLRGLPRLRWHIVEQPAFTAAGRAEFETEQLRFYASLAEVPASSGGARVALACGVLQYLEHPYRILDALAATDATHLIIDRTPVHGGAHDRLCVQQVPRQIYRASYPCWIFSEAALRAHLAAAWQVVFDYPSADGRCRTDDRLPFGFRGLVLERRHA